MSSDALDQINSYNEDDVPYKRKSSVIASGASTVQKAKRRGIKNQKNPWPYAQKTFVLDDNNNRDVIIRAFKAEVRILRHAKHHHVIGIIDAFELNQENERPQLAIVMPLTQGNINDYLTSNNKKHLERLRQWFHCLASVVDYIHGIGIRHRDIKPTNILVSEGKVFLADFGISSMGFVQTLSTTMPAIARSRTSSHCAPEVENGSSRGRSADIFSLGAVFLQMLVTHSYRDEMGKLADLTNDSGSPSFAKTVAQLQQWMGEFEQTMPHDADDWHHKVLALCRKMLHEDRDYRPQAFQVLQELSSSKALWDPASSRCGCANAVPETGDVALVEACKRGSINTVKELVESSKVSGSNVIGALHQASSRGHLPIVDYLLSRGANVNLQDHSGQTALHCAAGYGHEDIVDTLLQHSANISLRDSEGRTALHYAAGCGKSEIVKNLLSGSEGEASIAIRDEDGQTALHFAAKRGHTQEAEMLLDALTSTTKKIHSSIDDKKGRMAIHFAAGFGSHKLVNTLLAAGVDPNAQDSRRWTILHFAARGTRAGGAYEAVIELLLKHGADATRTDEDEHTAAFYATGCVKTLLWTAVREQEKKTKMLEQGTSDSVIESEELVGGNLPEDFHPDFLSFITIAQVHKVNVSPLAWTPELNELGKGATGEVRQVMVDSKSQFAFKRFASLRTGTGQHHRDTLPEFVTSLDFRDNTKLFTALISELVILSQSEVKDHRHIVDIQGIAFDVEIGDQDVPEIWPVLVMDKAQHGSLMGYVNSGNSATIDFAGRLRLCAQIGSAISTMHANNIVHGDVKPQNILMYDDAGEVIVKVTDFSYSCIGKSEQDVHGLFLAIISRSLR
ncbi:hypothetical protein ACQKWADRAFT_171945 [Trichoderma austrokoningii]